MHMFIYSVQKHFLAHSLKHNHEVFQEKEATVRKIQIMHVVEKKN